MDFETNLNPKKCYKPKSFSKKDEHTQIHTCITRSPENIHKYNENLQAFAKQISINFQAITASFLSCLILYIDIHKHGLKHTVTHLFPNFFNYLSSRPGPVPGSCLP